jgi:ribonuclease R
VGHIKRERGYCLVEPSNKRILDDILIPSGEDLDAPDEAIVSVEITEWPTRTGSPVGRVTDIIGAAEDPEVEAEVILRKYGLPNRFPDRVEAEAREVPDEVEEGAIKGREDLRGLRIITIDGETAKDFDDAVYVDRTKDGGYRLLVSIADVSHYVRPGTALDAEAFSRGTSVYFPARCIPMLPEALSNGICSLNPAVDRLTMTAEMVFDSEGRMTGKRFYESVIKSAERMTYTDVHKLIKGDDAEINDRYSRIREDVLLMAGLAGLLLDRRVEDGSIDFDLPEPQVILDIEGRTEDIIRVERNAAHRLIEEFMLAANRAVATEFTSQSLPFLYRVHDEPDRESTDDFAEFVFSLGLDFKPSGGPKAFQKVITAARGKPEERLVNTVLLRSMKQAIYSDENAGHFGLAFTDYTHFTSPIRRYPDLIVHRLLKLLMRGKYGKREQARMEAELPETTARSSATERKAMEAEREILDLKKTQFMKDKVGEVYEGFISGVTGFGLFVELKEWFVEGLVHVSSLLDDYYTFDDKRHTLTGEHTKKTFRLADEVTVQVTGVNIELRRIEMTLSGDSATPGGPRPRREGGGGRGDKKATGAKDKGKSTGRNKGGRKRRG